MDTNKDLINDNFKTNLPDLAKRYISIINKTTYDQSYVGKIVNNKDIQKLGRCKIRVYGIFGNEIPDDDLPWAIPDFEYIGSSLGSFIVPEIGTLVNVYFRDGDLYFPHYTTKILDKNNISQEKDEDYPDTMVFYETTNGDYFKINRKTFESIERHASGIFITKDINGNITIDTTDCNTGNLTIISNGDINVKANNINLDAPIGVKINASKIEFPKGPVVPDSAGGPFNCLLFDPLTGVPHSGNIEYGIYTP